MRIRIALAALVIGAILPAQAVALGVAETELHGPAGKAGLAMVTVHGGSWLLTGPGAMRSIDPAIRRWVRRGYPVYNVDYAPGKDGLQSLSAAVDRIAAERGSADLCLHGESAGGHLALMLATQRRDIRCVIASAAPLDLQRLGPALNPIVRIVFGDDRAGLKAWSPLVRAREIRGSVLLQGARDDRLVPISQVTRFRRIRPQTRVSYLEPGPTAWMHGTTSQRSASSAYRQEARFVRDFAIR